MILDSAGRAWNEEGSMPKEYRDVVCSMTLDEDKAVATAEYQSATYHFCSEDCRRRFEAEPARYAVADANELEWEKHEPPYTKTGPIVAPKFGSAGSGGLEYERLPEMHDEHGGKRGKKKDRDSK
jgi:YHS domain-containing protein